MGMRSLEKEGRQGGVARGEGGGPDPAGGWPFRAEGERAAGPEDSIEDHSIEDRRGVALQQLPRV
jgi:hypothetical protein